MNKTLPFELKKNHKAQRKYNWKQYGIIFTPEEFEYIYEQYIYCSNCDLCNKEFLNTKDRQLDHCHETGDVRNIICNSCNQKRKDNKIRKDNTSKHKLIYKEYTNNCKQGYNWKFAVHIDGKRKTIKRSIDLDFLVKYRDKWIKDNNYYT